MSFSWTTDSDISARVARIYADQAISVTLSNCSDPRCDWAAELCKGDHYSYSSHLISDEESVEQPVKDNEFEVEQPTEPRSPEPKSPVPRSPEPKSPKLRSPEPKKMPEPKKTSPPRPKSS
ncbi:hypothetical protein V2J09_005777 [Rumex salicifolius]